MMNYSYLKAVKADVMEYIKNEVNFANYTDRDELEEYLNDTLWIDDSVTGNASGSYTFNTYKAREYVLADMDTVSEALREFCDAATVGEKFLNEEWEYIDVTARCYTLGIAIYEALEEIESSENPPRYAEEEAAEAEETEAATA